jgi:hypothetical protein
LNLGSQEPCSVQLATHETRELKRQVQPTDLMIAPIPAFDLALPLREQSREERVEQAK